MAVLGSCSLLPHTSGSLIQKKADIAFSVRPSFLLLHTLYSITWKKKEKNTQQSVKIKTVKPSLWSLQRVYFSHSHSLIFSWDCEDLVLNMHGTSDKMPPQTSSRPRIMISKERWSSVRGWLWNKQLSTCSTTPVANVIVLISICNAHFYWQLSEWQMPLPLNQYGSWMTNNTCLWVTMQMKISVTTVKDKTNRLC